MEITKTEKIIYLKHYLNRGNFMQTYKRRVPCKSNEKMYKTNVYTLGNDENVQNELFSIYRKHFSNFKEYIEEIIADELHVSKEAIRWIDNNAYCLFCFDNFGDAFTGEFYLNCELEELELNDKDLAERKKEADNEHNLKMLKTFAKSSIENITQKYGVYYNDITNQLLVDRSELNNILLKMYSEMVNELSELGIKVKLTKNLVSIDNGKILSLTKNNIVKLEFNGGVIKDG